MKYLFLGGSKDGETMSVPDRDYIQVHVAKDRDAPVDFAAISPSTAIDYEVETYTRQKLRGENETFTVFAPTNWTGDMLIRHLIHRATKAERHAQ